MRICPLAGCSCLAKAISSSLKLQLAHCLKRWILDFLSFEMVLRIPTSFNLLLGRPWIHRAGAIPSFLHQKVKFIHDGDFVAMSFDQHNNTMVLDMMRGMSFLPSMGLGLCQQGPNEFIAAIDHDTTFGLGMSLVDYFVKGSKIRPRIEEIESVVHTDMEIELQHLFHQLQLSDGIPGTSVSMAITPPSPNRASLLSLCFPEEVIGDGMVIDPTEMIDGVIKETQTIPISELLEDDGSLFEGTIFDIDDEIAQPYSDRDSFDHDSNPINERVSLAIEDVEAVDFGTKDQPKELKIGSLLSTYKSDRLIHLLRSYLDVFAWSYEDMPSLDPSIVKEEIQKQLSVGFILVVEYLEWYNQILMAQKDMEKTTFITEWGTYCYRVMPFGLKNIRATYQRAATTLFHDMLHRNVEVYVDDMIVKSQGQADHLAALERFFERIQKFRLRLNPNNGTFGVTSRKLLGHMVSERGIEVDPDKIKAILDMLVSRIEKDIRGFLRRLQYISRFIARLTNILPPLPGHPLLLYFSVSDMALGSMLAQLDDSRNERAIYYMTYQSGYGIGVLLVSPQGDHISRSVHLALFYRHPITNNIVEYEACILGLETALELGIRQMKLLVERFDYLRYVHLPRAQNQFFDALATLASSIDIPINVVVHPLLNELRPAPACYCLIGETEKCPECQIHGDLFHAPLLELYALTLSWPFLVWGIDVIRKISPKSSNGHEFILVAIDYFTKWVEFASYARLTSARVASFIRSHSIFHYRVPHELISDRGVHFRAEIDTLLQRSYTLLSCVWYEGCFVSRDKDRFIENNP
ncbi:Retrovirus-related Pol polyprotein from transposon 17.6 [Vitis vinifera]|uniref:Retrovirus-related Pol polyprotein from transposon 17.6 n=1 Tax=Vitis vinifera TaxID=29760 RepID=A0A438EC48_VITVI|nr:Retrovirus-related Pol polyprotein from transposon 17.6 [Vitis vinifera]